MSRASKVMVILVVASLGAWGCARGPEGHGANQPARALESQCVKLKADYRAVAEARDQAQRRLTALETERARLERERVQLQKEVARQKTILRERDALRDQLQARTSERDTLQTRCERLKKGLQELLGQDATQTTPAASGPQLANTAAGVTMATH